MNKRKDGFLVVKTPSLKLAFSGMQGKRLPPKEIIKLSVIPCVWKYFYKTRDGQDGSILYPSFFEWCEPEEIGNSDFEYFVKSNSIADEYQKFEKNALENWEWFKRAYLEMFLDADLAELEKPEPETRKKKRKQRTVIDLNMMAEIVKMARLNPGLTLFDLEKHFGLGRGTISKNRKLANSIKEERKGTGRSLCNPDGTAYRQH